MFNISLILIDTDCHVLANEALRRSISNFKFDQILIFSDEDKWVAGDVQKIPKISKMEEHNDIIINQLPNYITTSHFLVIQFDGFILNPGYWSNIFLHYDYIGAPWPKESHGEHNVGNGGFSLRTQRLAKILKEKYFYHLSDPEDLHICKKLRPILEKDDGINFPHESIASHFSAESYIYRYPTFGFHNIRFLPLIYKDSLDFLIDNLSDRVIRQHCSIILPNLQNISPKHAERLIKRKQELK